MTDTRFKPGDKVRLKDGDGRTHIIKEIPWEYGFRRKRFALVVFEDNAAKGFIEENGYTDMTKKDIITSSEILIKDIYKCLTDLVHARMYHDKEQEEKGMFQMESLLCSSQQQLGCIIDYLKKEKE